MEVPTSETVNIEVNNSIESQLDSIKTGCKNLLNTDETISRLALRFLVTEETSDGTFSVEVTKQKEWPTKLLNKAVEEMINEINKDYASLKKINDFSLEILKGNEVVQCFNKIADLPKA